jgi:hypothetical protein
VQQAVAAPLSIFLELINRISARETALVDGEIKKRRQRLGGPALTAEATVKQVQAELLPRSQLPSLWRQVLDDPDAGNDEGLRRDTERRLLAHLRTTLAALPSSFDPPVVDLSGGKSGSKKPEQDLAAEQALKDHYREETERLARDMCVIGVPEAMAWEVEVEWSDVYADTEPEKWPASCWNALEAFSGHFPESVFRCSLCSCFLRVLTPGVQIRTRSDRQSLATETARQSCGRESFGAAGRAGRGRSPASAGACGGGHCRHRGAGLGAIAAVARRAFARRVVLLRAEGMGSSVAGCRSRIDGLERDRGGSWEGAPKVRPHSRVS